MSCNRPEFARPRRGEYLAHALRVADDIGVSECGVLEGTRHIRSDDVDGEAENACVGKSRPFAEKEFPRTGKIRKGGEIGMPGRVDFLAWCEPRKDFRTFRIERIAALKATDEVFRDGPGKTMEDFLARPRESEGGREFPSPRKEKGRSQ